MNANIFHKTKDYIKAQCIYEDCVILRAILLKYVREDVVSDVLKSDEVRRDVRILYVKTEELRDIGKDFKFEPCDKDTTSRFSSEHISFIQTAARDVITFIQQYQMCLFTERVEMVSGILALMTLFTGFTLQIKDQIIEQVSFGGFLVFVILSVLICILFSRQAGHYLLEFSRLIK